MSEATSETLLQIAKVLKSNGTEGGLLLGFRDIQPEDIDLQEPVFIEFDGLPVPFFFESFKKKGNDKAIVRLTDIQSLEDAEEVVGRAVYADESSIAEYEDDGEMSLDGFIGWHIFNGDKEVGEVIDYEDIPNIASEARQKLSEIRPTSLGQASRISGVNPADISILMVYLRKNGKYE